MGKRYTAEERSQALKLTEEIGGAAAALRRHKIVQGMIGTGGC